MKKFAPFAGWLALFFSFTALFFYAVNPPSTAIMALICALALVNALIFFSANWEDIRKSLTGRTAVYGANSLVVLVVCLGILVFINLLSYRHKLRADWTEQGLFTLSTQTEKIISTLPREVRLTAFFQAESQDKNKFRNLTDGYLDLTDKIKLEFIDPDTNPAISKQYGVKVYGTVALESGKNETKIVNPNEENLTNAILNVIRDEKKKLYFLEGHDERSVDKDGDNDYSAVRKALERGGNKVEKLLLLQTGKVPDDADLLVINGPIKPILPQEQLLIRDYLNRKGAVFILVDPQSRFGMEPLLEKWGIVLRDDIIVDPRSKLFGGDLATPVINSFAMHEITKDFKLALIFPLARSVAGKPLENFYTLELLKTGPEGWSETEYGNQKVQFDKEEGDRKGPVPIAAISIKEVAEDPVKEILKTNPIPGNKPEEKPSEKTDSDKPDDDQKDPDDDQKDKDFEAGGRLVVIGDSDFASNRFFNSSGNGDFFLKVISWLVQGENQVSIKTKERENRPLHLTKFQGSFIFATSVFVLPGIILISGIWTWWKRRAL
ncbi:MAG: Gldg family protein [Nitrospinales bacterium]